MRGTSLTLARSHSSVLRRFPKRRYHCGRQHQFCLMVMAKASRGATALNPPAVAQTNATAKRKDCSAIANAMTAPRVAISRLLTSATARNVLCVAYVQTVLQTVLSLIPVAISR